MLRQLSTQFFRIIHDAIFVGIVCCAHHVARAAAVRAVVDGGRVRASRIHNGDGGDFAGFANFHRGRNAVCALGPGGASCALRALQTLRPGFPTRALRALRPSRTRRASSTSRPLRPHNIYAGGVGKALVVCPRNHTSRAHSGRKRSAIVFAISKILLKLFERFLARFFRGHASLLRRNARGLSGFASFFLRHRAEDRFGFRQNFCQRGFRLQQFGQRHRFDFRVHVQGFAHDRVENIRIPHHGFAIEDLHLRAKESGFLRRAGFHSPRPPFRLPHQRRFQRQGKI